MLKVAIVRTITRQETAAQLPEFIRPVEQFHRCFGLRRLSAACYNRPMRILIIVLATLAMCADAAKKESGGTPAARPNFILLIADDMAWEDCGANGSRVVRTPNIDRLAKEGMRFTRGFVTASSCSPSRASIITGRYPHATDAEQLHWPLPGGQVTFVEKLKESGYWTAAAGKWHLGDAVKDRFDVVKEASAAGFQLPTGKDGKIGAMTASDNASGCAEWLPTLKSRPEDKPFFLWFAAFDPHREYETNIIARPHWQHEMEVPPYLPNVAATRIDLALYADEITRLDGFVGRVLDELDRSGQATNTCVLFISDNGRPFPREKTTLYDSGIRTPFIVRWPGVVKAGSVCTNLVSTVDIAPTFLEAAGLPVVSSFQGVSFMPMLENPAKPVRRHVYAERHWHDFEALQRGVRDTRFKYIRNYLPELPDTPPADALRSPTFEALVRLRGFDALDEHQLHCFVTPRPREELYDTENDPHELNNLVGVRSLGIKLNELRKALAEWQKETGDEIPAVRTPDDFDRNTGQPLPTRKRPRPSKAEMMGGAVPAAPGR